MTTHGGATKAHEPNPSPSPNPSPNFDSNPNPQAHEHQLVARGGTGNHATSGLKFRLLIPWLKVGCNVLLSDVDVVYMRNPFQESPAFLHRDSDVEAMTDGWSDATAYGWHMRLIAPPASADDGVAYSLPAAAPPARRMMRFWARNSGQFYVRATTASLRMMRTMATRMATEQVCGYP